MGIMEQNGWQDGAGCPRIVSAVLKAMRGQPEPADVVESLGTHLSTCQACRDRIAFLDRFIRSLSAQLPRPEDAEPAAVSRRKHRRLPTNEAVNLVFEDDSVILGRMTEVSARGAKIESPEALACNTRFTLNRGRRSLAAEVRHCTQEGRVYLLGVEYLRDEVRI